MPGSSECLCPPSPGPDSGNHPSAPPNVHATRRAGEQVLTLGPTETALNTCPWGWLFGDCHQGKEQQSSLYHKSSV